MRSRLFRVWESRFCRECSGDPRTRTSASTTSARLLLRLGFDERIKGSHHIYTRDGVGEILNLQTRQFLSKPYQVKQVRKILVQYKLAEEAE